MKHLPTISIITPSFNQGEFIKETIDSVLSQKYPRLEYWVIDGGSTDNTVKILKSYGNKIKWISEKDKGQTHAINKGIRKITGDIVGYLNSDDVLLPGALTTVAKNFILRPNILWLTGDYQIVDAQGTEIQSFVRNYKTFFRNLRNDHLLYILNYINQPSTFWRKSVFKKIGYFDENLRYCMDYDFWLRLVTQQSPYLIDRPLSKFRIHNNSKGGSQYQRQFIEETRVVKQYMSNPILTTLHKVHSAVTVQAYKLLK